MKVETTKTKDESSEIDAEKNPELQAEAREQYAQILEGIVKKLRNGEEVDCVLLSVELLEAEVVNDKGEKGEQWKGQVRGHYRTNAIRALVEAVDHFKQEVTMKYLSVIMGGDLSFLRATPKDSDKS